ncbi:MAG TPA: hypothetical protein VM490_00485 [Armatimonadaceae bacterium]|nr:hypothetical protein [Armatimonadaceae bacterium]
MPIGNGTGRSFVTLSENGAPTEVGFELTESAIKGLPLTPADDTRQFFVPMPTEAGSATPYVTIVAAYSTGHVPPHSGVEAVEPAHFHPVFLMNPPVPPQNPPMEDLPVAAEEIPEGHVKVGQVVPVLGSNYDDPTIPAGYPEKATLGQNIFYHSGHMNGMHVGESVEFLATRATRTGVIKQPQVYPKGGYYPHRWTVYFDTTRKTHVFLLSDFRAATRTI